MSGKMVLSLACRIAIWFAIINFTCVLRAKSDMRVGPWGGQGGDIWTYEPKGGISHITVTYDNVIHSICFTGMDENGNLEKSQFACKEANNTAEIDIDVKTEKLRGISGTFDTTSKCSKTITSLSFTTNSNKSYGPFGTVKGTAFSLVVKDDQGFGGFHGSSGWLVDSIGVSLVNPSTPTTEDGGPWGGPGGASQYDYTWKGEIWRIMIQYGGAIRTMLISNEDEYGTVYASRIIGGTLPTNGGDYPEDKQTAYIVLDFKNGERLVEIKGTVGTYLEHQLITSLQFSTNKGRTVGPFGGGVAAGDEAFSYTVPDNKYISGFYGRDGDFIDSFGVHAQAPPRAIGKWGNTSSVGKPWSYQPSGGIFHISITYKDAIYSMVFTSVTGNGNMVKSEKFGTDTGAQKAEIDIDPKNERFIGIMGTIGAKNGTEVIRSLTFFTNNNRTLGPFGRETGTAFSMPLKDGFISGFHGRSEKWLEAIGVYATPT